MTYRIQWNAIATLIKGLTRAAELHSQFFTGHQLSGLVGLESLKRQGDRIYLQIEKFLVSFETSLPLSARDILHQALTHAAVDAGSSRPTQMANIWSSLTKLSALEAEITYLLSDNQAIIKSVFERAISHLQRLIVVDENVRLKWQAAFRENEVACEKLGAIQLLHHGIWAFKINAEGERTDLVFQEVVNDISDPLGFSQGIVLTEWKIGSETDAETKFSVAREQAKRYAGGSLGGVELRDTRYIILVSQRQIQAPQNFVDGDVTYRYLNISVEPETPSVAARRLAAK